MDYTRKLDIPEDSSSEEEQSESARAAAHADLPTNYAANLAKLYDMNDEIVAETHHTWEIADWRGFKDNRIVGPTFRCGDFDFNLLIFPLGNNSNNVAVYLEPHPPCITAEKEDGTVERTPVDPNWHCCAQFAIDMWNPDVPAARIFSQSHHRFLKSATDWGFSSFVGIQQLNSNWKATGAPLVSRSRVNITTYVRVLRDTTGVLWHDFVDYDSKKETGFVGILNQGATCYLNSLLQSYFFTKVFRQKVYAIPTAHDTPNSHGTFPLAVSLQRAFYKLQKACEPISTSELTSAFGWTSLDAFTQHDVQELNRILMDKLEARMKGTPIEGCLTDIFVGKMKSYIKCVDVDYESVRVEDFWDIQLNVKNTASLARAFENYIEVEMLEGDNQYDASGIGLQDAKKGVVFESFPPVLHLQLKRFEYDFVNDRLVKINDRYEFPESIDLKPYLDAESEGYEEDWDYQLHGVLIHLGDFSSGHYYAMLRPSLADEWYRFDDDRVFRATKRQVFDENFGVDVKPNADLAKLTRHEYQEYQNQRFTNAYMLVYVRKAKLAEVMVEVEDADIPLNVSRTIESELREQERVTREKQEQHLYARLNVFTTGSFQHYQGYEMGPTLVHQKLFHDELYAKESFPWHVRVLKTDTVASVAAQIAENFGLDPTQFRLWTMVHRRNATVRPDIPVDMEQTIGALQASKLELNLWVEEKNKELHVVKGLGNLVGASLTKTFAQLPPTDVLFATVSDDSDDVVVLLKYFDVKNQRLTGLTHAVVNKYSVIGSLIPLVNRLLGNDPFTKLSVYEELQVGSIDAHKLEATFYTSEVGSGDILVLQQELPGESEDSRQHEKSLDGPGFYTTAIDFYNFLLFRTQFSMRPKSASDDDAMVISDGAPASATKFDFWCSSKAPYAEFAGYVARKIGADPDYLRFFAVGYDGSKVPLGSGAALSSILLKHVPAYQSVTFEYETLPIPLADYEHKRAVTVHWLQGGIVHDTVYELLVPVSSTVTDVIHGVQTAVGFENEAVADVLVWAAFDHKFVELLPGERPLSQITDTLLIYCGIFPQEADILGRQASDDVEVVELRHPQEPAYERFELAQIRLITAFQYNKDARRTHGAPFIFILVKGEPFSKTKQRLQQLTDIPEADFLKKVKVTTCTKHGSVRLSVETADLARDALVLYDEIHEDEFLCLDHPERAPRRASGFEKPIVVS
ncbi:hypothetical protein BABINDRAFT_163160 [Babjeviella inositovora NRRL Y-12698]|uniref:ubiquitinyl hydrolase 1 n=1 Tax=Babjeviella inositovora NRRL Y-12698 TaxID=984486 RepID=A0A1E3QJ90_9ASCO|nr:uncharacterized protein BABINDRAFT_163160 [Babjeviella inositovora NRRL Y-12698]ODQ77761.1 hypothetical protein BABINDRAFT_163160 [Babjeviella inositovora NRRL Y-12698]